MPATKVSGMKMLDINVSTFMISLVRCDTTEGLVALVPESGGAVCGRCVPQVPGPEAADALGVVRRILGGADERAEGRREFTRWFIRPCGLDVPASEVVASVIETAARPNADRAPVSAVARRQGVPGLSLASEGIGR